jgi:hypothetical protein
MKGLIAHPHLPIPTGGSSKEFTSQLFLREPSSYWTVTLPLKPADCTQQAHLSAGKRKSRSGASPVEIRVPGMYGPLANQHEEGVRCHPRSGSQISFSLSTFPRSAPKCRR